ncbi:MAG: CoA transferase [Chloroflexi bacterium]|nr:CoA transferase [Chloroflexota bacterium]
MGTPSPQPSPLEREGALAGLRVLDLSNGIAGAYCAKLLADFGATVVKVEPPEGDPTRRDGPFPGAIPHPEKSGLFLYLNTNKQGITLDPETETGAALLRKLGQRAQVLVESFPPGYLDRLGLGYAALVQANPALVMTSVTYFGQTGPYREWKGCDLIAWALGGLMYMTGEADREPLRVGGSQAEYIAGLHAAVATMGAVLYQEASGLGQHLDVSCVEAVASLTEGAALTYSYSGHVRGRNGARHHYAYPSTILPCRGGYIFVHAGGDWEAFCNFLEAPGLRDPKYVGARGLADEIDAQMQPFLQRHAAEEIFHQGQLWRIPFSLVQDMAEVAGDPQFRDRGFFVQTEHPEAGLLTNPGAPFRMPESPWRAGRAPLLGEHNQEVYGGWLGLEAADLALLRRRGVI